jgi:hypothetical protein
MKLRRGKDGRLEVYHGVYRVVFYCDELESKVCADVEIDLPEDKLPHNVDRRFKLDIRCDCGRTHMILV